MPACRLAPNPGCDRGSGLRSAKQRRQKPKIHRFVAKREGEVGCQGVGRLVSWREYRPVSLRSERVALAGREKEVGGWDFQGVGCGECCVSERPDAAGDWFAHHGRDPRGQVEVAPYISGGFIGFRNFVHVA